MHVSVNKMFLTDKFRKKIGRIYANHIGPRLSKNRALPDVVIIGGQKCGTTSLFYYLSQHPDIIRPKTKEIHFFDKNFHRGLDWYRFNIPGCRNSTTGLQLRFESSPYYLFHPAVPSRMHSVMPNAKLIVMLRDPATRAYSHYWHEKNRGREPLDFTEALDAEPIRLGDVEKKLVHGKLRYSFNHQHYSYFARGCYDLQIRRWLQLFPLKQFLFIESEAFFESPQPQMKRVLDFLELAPFSNFKFNRQNVGRYKGEMDRSVSKMLNEAYRPHNQHLELLIGQRFSWMDESYSVKQE